MKIRIAQTNTRDRGSALIIAVLTVMIIGLVLGSYLTLVSRQNESVIRSMAWNATVPVLEAGIEEALAHINQVGSDLNRLGENGWTMASDGWYMKTRTLGDGSGYITRIRPTDPPVVASTGVVPSPLRGALTVGSTEASLLAAAQDAGSFVRRTVRVLTRRDSLYAKGLVAKGSIDLLGNNVGTDSFDSEDPTHSTGGRYDPAKKKDNGDVATNSTITDSLDVGNANVMGHVSTGPGGSVHVGANGSVGDKAWVSTGSKGIQPGYFTADMNVTFPEVTLPFSSAPVPTGGRYDGTNYNTILDTGNYMVSSLDGSILVKGDAVVWVKDDLALTGHEYIYIEPGASLKMYVSAPSVNLSGHGVINGTGSALAFQYFGLPSNTSLSFSGNATFVGVIYAPNAAFTLGGGGNNIYDFVGASISDTVKMNGHFNFHYDEALARNGPGRGYVPNSWDEVDPQYTFAYSLSEVIP